MENKTLNSTPSVTRGTGTDETKKLFSPLSPCHPGEQIENLPVSIITPKRRLSLNLDGSMQSPGCEDVLSNEKLLLEKNRTPLIELHTNTSHVSEIRQILQAKRPKKNLNSLIIEPDISAFKVPTQQTVHSPRPSSLPSLAESSCQDSPQSWIRQINSPLEKMTLVSPSGKVVFTFGSRSSSSPSRSMDSSHSLPSHCLSSLPSTESDGYFSEFDVFDSEETTDSTSETIKTLLNAPLASDPPHTFSSSQVPNLPCPTPVRPQRANSSPQVPPTGSNTRPSLKRTSPSSELAQLHQPKRPPLPFLHCSNSQDSPLASAPPLHRHLKGRSLLRSQSYCLPPISVESAPLSTQELIGDDTMPYALPLVRGSLPELKCISSATLHKLMCGEFASLVDEYSIIDCRYPYEYKGGHIQGALNIWEKADLMNKFLTHPKHPTEGKRTIYIFHCEFSSKRGPEMCRFLREIDRKENGFKFFPKLYYPELYLLEGGYKDFYHAYSGFCEPTGYCPMLNEKHSEELRHFKQRAKSWAGDSIVQSRRQNPSRCRRRTTVNFDSRPKCYSLDSTVPHRHNI